MKAEIKHFEKRKERLKTERSSFIALYRELSDNHLSYRGRFLSTDRNKGHKRNTKQYNNTSRLASRTLASGMMAGITSPARPWFRLGTSDPSLREDSAVRHWLFEVQTRMYEVFSQSNTYNMLHQLYSELGTFGTGAMGVFHDFENVIHCQTYTVGSYMLGANGRNVIDTFYREYEYTVGQCVKEFGIENVSEHVRKMWKEGNTEAWIPIVHAIEPNDDRDRMSPLARNMPFRSVYYERGNNAKQQNKFLRVSGFPMFKILTPRWDIAGEDIYATDCPGMTALGDAKALQLGERKMYTALDKIVDPPLNIPVNMKNKVGKSLRPGEHVYTDSNEEVKSIYGNWRPDIDKMMLVNDRTEQRIKRAFYEDLFLMLAQSDRRQITAREVAEKHEEKLLMLGPVLERLHKELLDPLIDITFDQLQRHGVLPVPPEQLQNVDLKVEYISVLAQAQRLVAVGSVERLAGFAGELSAVWPEARHKIDAMQMIDQYADSLGTPPDVVRSDDVAEGFAEAEKQAAAQQQAAAQGAAMADGAHKLGNTPMTEDNALGSVMRRAGLA